MGDWVASSFPTSHWLLPTALSPTIAPMGLKDRLWWGSKAIERATDGQPVAIENVGVDHRGRHIFMAHQLLNSTMENNKTLDPVGIGLFRSVRVVLLPKDIT